MQSIPELPSADRSVSRFILRTFGVFAAALVPIVLLNGGFGILIGGIAIYYFLIRKGNAALPADAAAEPDPEFARFRSRRGVATFLVFAALSLPPIAAWILWAFPRITEPSGLFASNWVTLPAVILAIVALLLGSAIFAWMALASLRQNGESVGQGYRRALQGRAWPALRPAATSLALLFGMMGLAGVLPTFPGAIRVFESWTLDDRLPEALQMMIVMPGIPIWLYISILLVALSRRLDGETVEAHFQPEDRPIPGRSSPYLAGTAIAVSVAVLLGAMGNVLHLAILAVHGPVAEVGPITTVAVELEDWVDDQHESGRPSGEIVAALQQFGRWAPTSPDQGLVELLPALKSGKSFERIDGSTCRYSIEAGIADLDELRGIDWLPEGEATHPVKYCLSIACPSPTRWPGDVTHSLSSSHTSQNRFWIESLFLDVFAWGVAEPGGYCAISGAVADHFQG